MKIKLTVDVFSGRPNPVMYVEGREAEEVAERLRPARRIPKNELRPVPESSLGYRGIHVEFLEQEGKGLPRAFRYVHGEVFGPRLGHFAADPGFEDFVCGSTGLIRRVYPDDRLPERLKIEIERLRGIRLKWPPFKWPLFNRCQCAPLYEPAWWNDGGVRQFNNNCYNYGTNYRTDTFAQPGRAAGAMYTSLTCASVRPAAEKDELISAPSANNKCPKEGHLVGLVIAPGWDFHWYRKGRNGYWTHKPGSTPVTNLDNSGHTIPDPRTADRGPYTDFCTFMVVIHGHIKIN